MRSTWILTWGRCPWAVHACWVDRIRHQTRRKRWWSRPQIALCFSISSILTGAASSVSSFGPPRRRHHELWISSVFVLVHRRNRCLRVSICGSSSFVAAKKHHPIPRRYPVVLSSSFSYVHRRPRQIGFFVCFWNDARIRTLHHPRWPWNPRERHHMRESVMRTQYL